MTRSVPEPHVLIPCVEGAENSNFRAIEALHLMFSSVTGAQPYNAGDVVPQEDVDEAIAWAKGVLRDADPRLLNVSWKLNPFTKRFDYGPYIIGRDPLPGPNGPDWFWIHDNLGGGVAEHEGRENSLIGCLDACDDHAAENEEAA